MLQDFVSRHDTVRNAEEKQSSASAVRAADLDPVVTQFLRDGMHVSPASDKAENPLACRVFT
jgi:hypothetical protein